MIKLVKEQDNQIVIAVEVDENLSALSGEMVLGSITKSIPEFKNGNTILFTADDVSSLELGKSFAVLTVRTANNDFKQIIRVPIEVLPEGSDRTGFTALFGEIIKFKKDGGGGTVDHIDLPITLNKDGKKYTADVVDDDDGIDLSLTRQ